MPFSWFRQVRNGTERGRGSRENLCAGKLCQTAADKVVATVITAHNNLRLKNGDDKNKISPIWVHKCAYIKTRETFSYL